MLTSCKQEQEDLKPIFEGQTSQLPDLSNSWSRSKKYVTELKLQVAFSKRHAVLPWGLAGTLAWCPHSHHSCLILEDSPRQDAHTHRAQDNQLNQLSTATFNEIFPSITVLHFHVKSSVWPASPLSCLQVCLPLEKNNLWPRCLTFLSIGMDVSSQLHIFHRFGLTASGFIWTEIQK